MSSRDQPPAVAPMRGQRPLSDEDLRAEWRAAGGEIHGPNVETMTMPERQYFVFRRGLGLAPSAIPAWSREDSAAATAEGWDVFDSSERGQEIERIDDPEIAIGDFATPAFASDDLAIGHVYVKAQEGSALHQKALLLTLTRMKDFAWPASPAPELAKRSVEGEAAQYDGEEERAEAVFLQQQRDRADQSPDVEPVDGGMRP